MVTLCVFFSIELFTVVSALMMITPPGMITLVLLSGASLQLQLQGFSHHSSPPFIK
jgi:hypothetical protein